MIGTQDELSGQINRRRKKILVWVCVLAAMNCLVLFACGCSRADAVATVEGISETEEAVVEERTSEEWAAYVPEIITREDGRQIQKTPLAGPDKVWMGLYGEDWPYYNTFILNADNRGCNSCHALDDALKANIDHHLYYGAYEAEPITYGDCIACHSAYDVDVKDFMHGHMNYESFNNMGGNCNSCHYIDDADNYEMWDMVKNDVLKGITDVSSEEIDVDVAWNQTEITPLDKMFVESKAEADYEHEYFEHTENYLEEYSVKLFGEVLDAPVEMTIQEMIDACGTETRVEASQCVINGPGSSYIYQAEITGIPMKKLIEHLGLDGAITSFTCYAPDGYAIQTTLDDYVLESNPLLVYEVNGEELTDEQGYPLRLWNGGGRSAGANTRYITDIEFKGGEPVNNDPLSSVSGGSFGGFVFPGTEALVNKPNIGVLTAESGQIFPAGQPIHLEGYANAYNEPIQKLEFSFDRGETWIEVATENTNQVQWVYWKMDIGSLTEPGSYLLKMRATSLDLEGNERVNEYLPSFLINVQ